MANASTSRAHQQKGLHVVQPLSQNLRHVPAVTKS